MDTERELLKGNTPTLVMAVLRDGPLHGYGIAREIERRSANALRFKEGTLYPALHGLERVGWVVGEWEMQAGGRKRKIYTLTPAGRTELERRTRTWNAFATAIQSILGGDNHGENEKRATPEGTLGGFGAVPHSEPAG